jgi:hypothetical protein
VYNAGKPCIPPTYLDAGVPDRGGAGVNQESAVHLALALHHEFLVHGVVMECIEVFKYLGCLHAQDNNNAQAIWQQLQKARRVWAHVQVLHGENTAPRIAAKFYKAGVQAVLLYRSKTWNLTNFALARLEGFHVCTAYNMARKHQPKKGANGVWVYPKMTDVLEECGIYPVPLPDDCNVRDNDTNLQGLCGGQMAARVDAASMVVGATNVLGRSQCN